jgi:hypothetical protein
MKLKRIILSLLLIVSFNYCFGQYGNNPNLDLHRNFKSINLGDSFAKWANQLSFKAEDGNVKQYVFNTGYCCNTLFDFDAELVTVLVQNSKIVSIKIDLKKFQTSNTSIEKGFRLYESIENQFTTLFGKPYAKQKNQDNPMIFTQWLGNKTVLELKYNYYGVTRGDRAEVKISDLTYLVSSLKSGF